MAEQKPIKYAAKRADFDEMQRLLEASGDCGIDWSPPSGWTCMHHAAEHNRQDVCRWLLSRGARADLPLPPTDPKYPAMTAEQILATHAATWQWDHAARPDAPQFHPYEPAVSEQLEAAFQGGCLTFSGTIDGSEYTIAFRSPAPGAPPVWMQTLTASPGHWRTVRRWAPQEHRRWRDFGRTVQMYPPRDEASGQRQRVLLDTLAALQRESGSRAFHRHAQANLQSWAAAAAAAGGGGERRRRAGFDFDLRVEPGDWGEVTLALTREWGKTFAVLNMANADVPGGGYVEGAAAQEENMFRRTDCHFAVTRAEMDKQGHYLPRMTELINATDQVYLDASEPRVCVRGKEEQARPDLGYAWLDASEVFPFYELRAAAVDLRAKHGDARFDYGECVRRVDAQVATLQRAGVRHVVLSAFGCGAFQNPAPEVARAYREVLARPGVSASFDCVAFAIFYAGYGPTDNYDAFTREFGGGKGGGFTYMNV